MATSPEAKIWGSGNASAGNSRAANLAGGGAENAVAASFLPKCTSNISIHFHCFHAGAFFVPPYNEQRQAPSGLRYTPPLSPRKGRESSCLPMCSAKDKTVVTKSKRRFSRRYVASITKSKRSCFQNSFEIETQAQHLLQVMMVAMRRLGERLWIIACEDLFAVDAPWNRIYYINLPSDWCREGLEDDFHPDLLCL